MQTPFVLCAGSQSRAESRAPHPGPSPSCSPQQAAPPHPASPASLWPDQETMAASQTACHTRPTCSCCPPGSDGLHCETPFRPQHCPEPSLVPPQEEAHTGWMSDRDMTWCTMHYCSIFTKLLSPHRHTPCTITAPHHHHCHHDANTSLPLSPITTIMSYYHTSACHPTTRHHSAHYHQPLHHQHKPARLPQYHMATIVHHHSIPTPRYHYHTLSLVAPNTSSLQPPPDHYHLLPVTPFPSLTPTAQTITKVNVNLHPQHFNCQPVTPIPSTMKTTSRHKDQRSWSSDMVTASPGP